MQYLHVGQRNYLVVSCLLQEKGDRRAAAAVLSVQMDIAVLLHHSTLNLSTDEQSLPPHTSQCKPSFLHPGLLLPLPKQLMHYKTNLFGGLPFPMFRLVDMLDLNNI